MKNKKCILPCIKKDIKNFLTETDGKVNKKDIAKIAMGVLAVGASVSSLGVADSTNASCATGSYSGHGSWASSCSACY